MAFSIKGVGLALLLAVCLLLLRELGWRGVGVFAAIGVLSLLMLVREPLLSIFSSEIFLSAGEHSGELSAAIKVLGVGYLFGISSDVLRTLGEERLASTLELVGRVEILLIILPYVEEIIKIGAQLLG